MKWNAICLVVLCSVLVNAGCSSTSKARLSKSEIQKVNWSDRIGSYTWSDAIADLGQPAVHGESTEGKTGEWIIHRSPQVSLGFGVGSSSYGHNSAVGVGTGTTITPPPRGEYLRLQFDKNDKLTAWTKVNH